MPPVKHTNVTFKRAPKAVAKDADVLEIDFTAQAARPPLRKVAEPPGPGYEAAAPKKKPKGSGKRRK